MTSVVVAHLLGAVVASLLWRAIGERFDVPAFQRRNYRDAPILTGAGLLVPVAYFAVAGAARLAWSTLADRDLVGWQLDVAAAMQAVAAVGAVVAGFGLLGLLDDLGGVGDSGGFRGHLRALSTGRLTTGGLKLLGGPLVALVGVASLDVPRSTVALLRDGAVVALAANLVNLFDRAPGRADKVAQLGFALTALASRWSAALAPEALAVGAGLGLLRGDLREELMLGDAGSNALGAAVGLALVSGATPTARWIVLAGLAVANVASERWSFSRVIDRFAPLRALDRWGSPYRR